MVSVHPNPQPGQGFTPFYNSHFSENPMMKTTENDSFPQTAAYWSAGAEDHSKKFRKPYTITKSRESWTEMEHEKFVEALHLFDRDWKKIEAFVGSKTVVQIRSHAQKHFMKVQKNGIKEHVPPPRPKRKAAHPYPHKAPKNVVSQPSVPLSSAALLNSNYAVGPPSISVPENIMSSAPSYPFTCMVPTGCDSPLSRDDFTLSGGAMSHNWSSNSNDVAPPIWASSETNSQLKEKLVDERALPDFAQVYSFIGSIFDPCARDHLEELKKMDPINIETVLLLMKNLAVNLVSPEFDNHRKLLSSYNVNIQNKGNHTDNETTFQVI